MSRFIILFSLGFLFFSALDMPRFSNRLTGEELEEIVREIDERVMHLTENHIDFQSIWDIEPVADGDARNRSLYKDGVIIFRFGILEYYAPLEGSILYNLYYSENGRLIFASVTQYRASSYSIYFHNDEVIRFILGDLLCTPIVEFDDLMLNAIELCLKNAYIVGRPYEITWFDDDGIAVR